MYKGISFVIHSNAHVSYHSLSNFPSSVIALMGTDKLNAKRIYVQLH